MTIGMVRVKMKWLAKRRTITHTNTLWAQFEVYECGTPTTIKAQGASGRISWLTSSKSVPRRCHARRTERTNISTHSNIVTHNDSKTPLHTACGAIVLVRRLYMLNAYTIQFACEVGCPVRCDLQFKTLVVECGPLWNWNVSTFRGLQRTNTQSHHNDMHILPSGKSCTIWMWQPCSH